MNYLANSEGWLLGSRFGLPYVRKFLYILHSYRVSLLHELSDVERDVISGRQASYMLHIHSVSLPCKPSDVQ